MLDAWPSTITLLHQICDNSPATTQIPVRNLGEGNISWTITAPVGIDIVPLNGDTSFLQPDTVTISVPTSGRGEGAYSFGNVSITATIDGDIVLNSPSYHPLTLIVCDIQHFYFPRVAK